MNSFKLLQNLYNSAFAGDIDKVSSIVDELLEAGVSYRLQNQVLTLAYSKCIIDDIVLTIEGLCFDCGFNLPSLN